VPYTVNFVDVQDKPDWWVNQDPVDAASSSPALPRHLCPTRLCQPRLASKACRRHPRDFGSGASCHLPASPTLRVWIGHPGTAPAVSYSGHHTFSLCHALCAVQGEQGQPSRLSAHPQGPERGRAVPVRLRCNLGWGVVCAAPVPTLPAPDPPVPCSEYAACTAAACTAFRKGHGTH
jgi:hypothetical protein